MRVLSRDFNTAEKALLLVLVLVLLGLGYYQFVWRVVDDGVGQANAERDALQVELEGVEEKLEQLRMMQRELDSLDERLGRMESYNNARAEIALLNDVLKSADSYTVSFSNVTRNGDLVRRDFTMSFTASDFDTVRRVLRELSESEYRCLVGNVSYNARGGTGSASVNMTGTFYETMQGGAPDVGLPGAY